MKRFRRWLRNPRYGTWRYKFYRSRARLLLPVSRKRHESELSRIRNESSAYARRQVKEAEKEANEKLTELLPRFAAATLEFDRESQAFRLTTWLSDGMVRGMYDYPGDAQRMWEYVGERLGYEVARQLKTMDFGMLVRGESRVVLGRPPSWSRA